jgi:glycosyltransferase involved in cell wall biosynthesis
MNPLAPGSRPEKVDVVVPVYKNVPMTVDCLRSVLACSGARLGRLLVFDDRSPEPEMAGALARVAQSDARVQVVTNERNLGFVETCNAALRMRKGDVVLLNSDTVVTDGWLDELSAVAYTDERTACVSPLSNNATICSVPNFPRETPADALPEKVVRQAVAGLPRQTITPTVVGFCLYLRGAVLDLVGGFDPIYSPGYNEENDWIMRAQSMGFVARRANHALVYHLGSISFDQKRNTLEEDHARILNTRYPHYHQQVHRFCASLDGSIASHAVRIELSGRMRVALDLRGLGRNRVGSNVYAHQLAERLAASKQVELTILERAPQELERLGVRVLQGEPRLDDVEIIHKPSQVFDPADLPLLYGSRAHVVLTYQDLIAHHAQSVWNSQTVADRYRDMSHFSLHAAQGVIAISETTRQEIVEEFGIPESALTVVPHGIDAARYEQKREEGAALRSRRGVPDRYFLYIGTDFAHKNVAGLVAAFQLLRYEWKGSDGPPPDLVLAGATSSAPEAYYRRLRASPVEGVLHYGEIDDDFLRALYQGAIALTFGSVYEGFGLPPLEAMAAGTPVIAMPVSAVLEVCGDAAAYPERLDPESLAAVMLKMARSPALRSERAAAGRERVRQFDPSRTLELTLAAYRKACLHPPDESLRFRRFAAGQIQGIREREVIAPSSPAETSRSRLAKLFRLGGAR